MIRLVVGFVAGASLFVGCGGSSAEPSTDATSSGTADASATSDGPPTSGSATAPQTSTSEGSSSSGEPDETTTSEGSTSSGTTGDDSYFCNGWDERATRPFLEVYSDAAMQTPMGDGSTWPITCGGQGSWMFPVFPAMGGFTPAQGMVSFAVDIQVEGFTGPGGQFHLSPMYPYDVECSSGGETFDGGFTHDCIAIFPPDEYLEDLSVLDGAIAAVHIDLLDPEGTAVASVDFADVVLSAEVRPGSEDFCF